MESSKKKKEKEKMMEKEEGGEEGENKGDRVPWKPRTVLGDGELLGSFLFVL